MDRLENGFQERKRNSCAEPLTQLCATKLERKEKSSCAIQEKRIAPLHCVRQFVLLWAHAQVVNESYLVDPASSHMLVSKIKPCMSKYKSILYLKLRKAH